MDEEALFLELLEISSPAERAARLAAATEGNEALRQSLEQLLKLHEKTGDFLRGSPAAMVQTIVPAANEAPGMQVGLYKLLEQIGEGGFGTVFMADQHSPVRRRVALKVIKPGMDTRQVLARFKAEQQALALMDHPNIARVLDAGATDSGRPYFVMELVRGVPITDYCDQNNLPVHERLDLFVEVCHAVQHAHQKGIIHRDIKPSNILVTVNDGRPVPKVIDFGVAKAINQQLTPDTVFTGFAEMIGTPLYMSPEQAEMTSLDIDTRSDVYSLGVLLYELLTGSTPIDKERLKQAAFDEIRRIIREEEPAKPSTRISTLGDARGTVAAQRQADAHRLSQLLRGDLDWIAMKALEKDRSHRYETANGLAMDVQRYLANEPVLARPPSAVYRFGKFARRNRVAFTTAMVLLAAILMGTVVSVTQAIRATRAERLAQARLQTETEARNDADRARQDEADQRQNAEAQRAEAEKMRSQAEANFKQARRAVDDMYTQFAEKWLVNQPQLQPIQREFLQKALQFYVEFSQQTSTDPAIRLEAARAYHRVAEIQYRLGDAAQAEQAYRQALDRSQKLVDEFPEVPEHRQELAKVLLDFAVMLSETRRLFEVEKLGRRAIEFQEKLVAEFPAVADYRRDFAQGLLIGADWLTSLHQWSEAEKVLRSALATATSLVAEFPAVVEYREILANTYAQLAMCLGMLGQREQRLEAHHAASDVLEKLVAEFPDVRVYRQELAVVYYWLACVLPPQEAEQSIRRALALQEKLAADFPDVTDCQYGLMRSLHLLGSLMGNSNRQQEAEHALRQAAAIGQKLTAECSTIHFYRERLARVYRALADVLKNAGKLPEAEVNYRQAVELLTDLAKAAQPSGEIWALHGYCYENLKQWDKAIASYDKIVEKDPKNAWARYKRAYCYQTMKQWDKAIADYDKAIELDPKAASSPNELAWLLATCPETNVRDPARAIVLAKKAVDLQPKVAIYWNTLGVAQYRTGDWAAAIEALNKSRDLQQGNDAFDWFFLAMAHWQLGNNDEARQWFDKAQAWTQKNAAASEELRRFQAEAAELLGIAVPADGPERP